MLETIKLALFDFDDTLAIHRDADYIRHRIEAGENNYYKNAMLNPYTFYDEIEVCDTSADMLTLIKYFRSRCVNMYCLSGMNISLHSKAKQSFIDKHYGKGIELLTASAQELKLTVVNVLREIENLEPSEILIVDDRKRVVESMTEHGYVGVLTSNVPIILKELESKDVVE